MYTVLVQRLPLGVRPWPALHTIRGLAVPPQHRINGRVKAATVVGGVRAALSGADFGEAINYRGAGATHILNQAVLLKGINDSSEILKELCEKGFDMGILPYYVHQLDKVHGSAHFQVSRERALELEEQLRKQLPGYLLPKFVTEIEGKESKMPLKSC